MAKPVLADGATMGVQRTKINEGFDDTYAKSVLVSSNTTLTATQCYNSIVTVTAAADVTLLAVADGMGVVVVTEGDVAVSVIPDGSEVFVLDGAPLTGGNKVTNTSSSGDTAVFTKRSANTWTVTTNGWTDGGA
jgi:hypothetical protein